MANSIAHGVRSTANQVLAGIDLTALSDPTCSIFRISPEI
jgi:hypothetical protein